MLLRFIRSALGRRTRPAPQSAEFDAHRIVLVEGKSYSEAAIMLDVSEGEIQTRVLRVQRCATPEMALALD